MHKWEYCVITGVFCNSKGVFTGKYPRLYMFSTKGIAKETDLGSKASSNRPQGLEKMSEGEYIAANIAELGCEGWEMVETGMGALFGGEGGAHYIYFRRPLA